MGQLCCGDSKTGSHSPIEPLPVRKNPPDKKHSLSRPPTQLHFDSVADIPVSASMGVKASAADPTPRSQKYEQSKEETKNTEKTQKISSTSKIDHPSNRKHSTLVEYKVNASVEGLHQINKHNPSKDSLFGSKQNLFIKAEERKIPLVPIQEEDRSNLNSPAKKRSKSNHSFSQVEDIIKFEPRIIKKNACSARKFLVKSDQGLYSSFQRFSIQDHIPRSTNDTDFQTGLYNSVEGSTVPKKEARVSLLSNLYTFINNYHQVIENSKKSRPSNFAFLNNEAQLVDNNPSIEKEIISYYKNNLQKIDSEESILFQNALLIQSKKISNLVLPYWKKKYQTAEFYFSDKITKEASLLPNEEAQFTPIKNSFTQKECEFDQVLQGQYGTCSIISALICLLSRCASKASDSILDQIIFPKLEIHGKKAKKIPKLFGVKIYINGGHRLVLVHSTIHYNSKKKPIGVRKIKGSDPRLSLIEKAIMKIYGNQIVDIPSNTGIELFHLLGWIPETLFFRDINDLKTLWERLLSNIQDNNILICLGTDEITDPIDPSQDFPISKTTHLMAKHHYSVIGAFEKGETKILRCINPLHEPIPTFKNSQVLKNTPIFDITWEDVVSFFSFISLVWNPSIYDKHLKFHSVIPIPKKISVMHDEQYCLEHNPQFLISIPPHAQDFEVRILFQKHISRFDLNSERKQNRISYKLFNFDGTRIVYPRECLRTTKYSAREVFSDVFIFENSCETEEYILAILLDSENVKDSRIRFSLDVYSFVDLTIYELPVPLVHDEQEIEDEFGEKAGGCLDSPNCIYNPQFRLKIKEPTHIQLKVELLSDQKDPIMIIIFKSGGDLRYSSFDDVADYKRSASNYKYCFYEAILTQKDYTIIIATENPVIQGKYRITLQRIKNDSLVYVETFPKLKKIEFNEFKNEKIIHGDWTRENSKGSYRIDTTVHQAFLMNPSYIITVLQNTQVTMSLKPLYMNKDSIPCVSLCIYERKKGNKYHLLEEDESYAPRPWGYYSGTLELKPSAYGYLVVCVNYDRGDVGPFELKIMSTHPISEDIVPFLNIFKKPFEKTIVGKWGGYNSGGSSSNPTFYKNPQYQLDFKKKMTSPVRIELMSRNPDFGVGMVLLETSTPIEECCADLISRATTTQAFMLEYNYLEFIPKRNTLYNLIVSTFNPKEEAYYDLTVRSSSNFEIEMFEIEEYETTLIFQGKWRKVEPPDFFKKNPIPPMKTLLKSPNYLIKPDKNTKMRAHLFSSSEISVALHLIEYNLEESTYELVKDSGPYSPFKMGTFLKFELRKNNNIYFLVCSKDEEFLTMEANYFLNLEFSPKAPNILISNFEWKDQYQDKLCFQDIKHILTKNPSDQ